MKPDRAVGNWLLVLAAMVFGMVVGGGHARTIGAGFVMQSWHPVTGFIPPLGAAGWAHEFALFQRTAQFQAQPIDLPQFKALYWPMFLDRCWGRLMALVFLLPFGVFLWQRRISRRLALWLAAIFAAGAGQAVFGWYMVRTGLEAGIVSPPPEWAAPHFLSAMLIFAALLWTGLALRNPAPAPLPQAAFLKPWLNASIGLILLTMGFGALVATSGALHVDNTFPLMGGRLVPAGLLSLQPDWLNFVTNKVTVQFCHRALATLTALAVFTTCVLGLRAELSPGLRDNFLILAGLVALQYLLGMATLVLAANALGFIHELNAVLLLAAAICARSGLRGSARARMLAHPLAVGAE